MAENTRIEWCDRTFRPWVTRAGAVVLSSDSVWQQPKKWNRDAELTAGDGPVFGRVRRPLVYVEPDVFENRDGSIRNSKGEAVVDPDWQPITLDDVLARLFRLIDETPHLTWLLLTKRPENIRRMWASFALMPPVQRVDYALEFPSLRSIPDSTTQMPYRANVWLGTSISDQASANNQIPNLLKCPDLSPVLFVSAEPRGPVDLTRLVIKSVTASERERGKPDVSINALHGWYGARSGNRSRIDWLICGGESGPNARPMHPAWARSLRDQCVAAGVPFFFKQWGQWVPSSCCPPCPDSGHYAWPWAAQPTNRTGDLTGDTTMMVRVGKKSAGRTLDGREWNEMPEIAGL